MLIPARCSSPAVLLLALLLACSGGDNGGVADPDNRPPTVALEFSKVGVVRNSSTTFSVDVGDPDNDELTISWLVTRGTINPLDPPTTATWTAPGTVGVDSITVTVSDGTASRSTVLPIKVGFALTNSVAPSVLLKSRSPYIVKLTSGVVLAVAGATTTIEPGTELLLETANMVIDVTDTLLAVGTELEPIVIRPNIRTPSCIDDGGFWEGIKVSTDPPTDGVLQMEYATVSYAQYAVRLRDGGSAYLTNCHIRCSGQNGILHEGGGVLVVEDSEIRDGGFDGIAVNSLTFQPDSILVSGCYVGFNGRTGMALKLQDQQIEVPIIVEYTNFELNREHGITLDGAVFPRIHYNRFFGNGSGRPQGLNNIWLFNGFPNGATAPTLNATCNYFGTVSNVATIEATVRDQQDFPGIIGTDVIVSPWSNENPLTTPSTCVWP